MVWVKMHPLKRILCVPWVRVSYDVLKTTATKRYQIVHGDRCWCTDQKNKHRHLAGGYNEHIHTQKHKHTQKKKIANCLTLIRVTAPQRPVASRHDTNHEQLRRSERRDIMRTRTGGGKEGMVDSPEATVGWRWWLVCWWWMKLFSVISLDDTK